MDQDQQDDCVSGRPISPKAGLLSSCLSNQFAAEFAIANLRALSAPSSVWLDTVGKLYRQASGGCFMSIKKANEPERAPHGTLRVMQCFKVEKSQLRRDMHCILRHSRFTAGFAEIDLKKKYSQSHLLSLAYSLSNKRTIDHIAVSPIAIMRANISIASFLALMASLAQATWLVSPPRLLPPISPSITALRRPWSAAEAA